MKKAKNILSLFFLILAIASLISMSIKEPQSVGTDIDEIEEYDNRSAFGGNFLVL